MPYVDPDQDNSTAPATDNTGVQDLAKGASTGQLGQAVARKNARRGGTPNAPEVDDEIAPASNNGSTAPQGIAAGTPAFGPVSDAQDQYAAGVKEGGIATGLGRMANSAIGSSVASLVNGVGSVVKPIANFVGGAIGVNPTPPRQAGVLDPGAVPQATIDSFQQPPAAPTTVPATAPPPVAQPAPEVGSDLNPGPFHQQYVAQQQQALAQQAQEANAQQSQATRNLSTTDALAASQDVLRAEGEARVANFHARNAATDIAGNIGGNPYAQLGALRTENDAAGAANAKVAGLRGVATALNKEANTAGNTDAIGDLGRTSGITNANIAAQQTTQQNTLLNPLHVQQLQQAIKSGGTAQQIAELQLAGHQSRQGIIDELGKTTDPARHLQLTNALLAMEGKEPQSPFELHAVAGGTNPVTGLANPASAFVLDKRTGTATSGDQQIAAQAPKYPDGTKGTKDGVRGSYVGGKFVPEKK